MNKLKVGEFALFNKEEKYKLSLGSEGDIYSGLVQITRIKKGIKAIAFNPLKLYFWQHPCLSYTFLLNRYKFHQSLLLCTKNIYR